MKRRPARSELLKRLKSLPDSVLWRGDSPGYAAGARLQVVDNRGLWDGLNADEASADPKASIQRIYNYGVFMPWDEMDDKELQGWYARLGLG